MKRTEDDIEINRTRIGLCAVMVLHNLNSHPNEKAVELALFDSHIIRKAHALFMRKFSYKPYIKDYSKSFSNIVDNPNLVEDGQNKLKLWINKRKGEVKE